MAINELLDWFSALSSSLAYSAYNRRFSGYMLAKMINYDKKRQNL